MDGSRRLRCRPPVGDTHVSATLYRSASADAQGMYPGFTHATACTPLQTAIASAVARPTALLRHHWRPRIRRLQARDPTGGPAPCAPATRHARHSPAGRARLRTGMAQHPADTGPRLGPHATLNGHAGRTHAPTTMRDYLQQLAATGDLVTIERPIDPRH